MNSSENDEQTSTLMVNQLVYMTPPSLSLATNRSLQRQFAQRRSYTQGETVVFQMNSGSDYCDPENSYMVFDVKITQTNADGGLLTCDFGSGSAANLFNSIVVRSKSGTELDRINFLNVWSRLNSVFTESNAYLTGAGLREGFIDPSVSSTVRRNRAIFSTSYRRFVLPLKRLSGVFNPMKGQKLPACLMSGLQIELVLENTATAFVQVPGTLPTTNVVTGYFVDNICIVTDNITLTDDTQRALNSESANSGLEIAYPRVFTTITDSNAVSTALNVQIRKAVSQSSLVVSSVINTANRNDISIDSFTTSGYRLQSVQHRVGSLYFPQQELVDPYGEEVYNQTLLAFNKIKNTHAEPSVDTEKFKNGYMTIAQTLEKDQLLDLSGLALNNSRICEVSAVYNNLGEPYQVFTFLIYNAVSRSYLDNTSVGI
jgi:hypothetical protein